MKKLIVALLVTALSLTSPVMAATLKRGDSSDKVRKLQEALIENGYLSGNADGQFGPMTEDAVKLYQQLVGVSDTGVINDIQYLNITHESSNAPEKKATNYDYSDWKQFASSYEKTSVRPPTESVYYVNDYIGRSLSDFCVFNSGALYGSDGSVELIFDAGNFGDKQAGLTIGANNYIGDYLVVYQDPMPDSPIYFSAMENGKAKVRLGVIDKQMLAKTVLSQNTVKNYVSQLLPQCIEAQGFNYYDNYDGQKIRIKLYKEDTQENICFEDTGDLSRYTVISQNYPAGTQITFTGAGAYVDGNELKNIKLVVRETVQAQRNAIDLDSLTRQQVSASTYYDGGSSGNAGSWQGLVWLTETGEKYHKIRSCGNTNESNAWQVTIAEAERLGYTACRKKSCFG